MGLFGKLFHKIGHGLSKATHTIGHGLSKVFKPVYKHVLKPIGKAVGRIGKTALDKGEHFVEGGLDFSSKVVDKGRQAGLNIADAGANLTSFLKNPLVLIGGGLVVLMVVTR
jgi:hypothetical protein